MGLSRPNQLSDVERLLTELCLKLGICLPPAEERRLALSPPADVDGFTDAVSAAEGMGDMRYTDLHRQAREIVERHMSGWAPSG
jgi:hypothetical protein